MHMADALLSPAVGGVMWAVSAGLIGYSSKKIKDDLDDRKIPLMGVLGAFIFATQMINIAIPGTGSSGHLGGGLILAILLGPFEAFLTMASILTIQALFFADGGLLALGCNIFNSGFYPSFLAYPLIYKKIARNRPSETRILIGALAASIFALQLGSLSVVVQTLASGVSELNFKSFIIFMQPIHLIIGVVEGLVTTAVVIFVLKARPEIIGSTPDPVPGNGFSLKKLVLALAVLTVITGGVLSWFASTNPDGLEWSISKSTEEKEVKNKDTGLLNAISTIHKKTAPLPNYNLKNKEGKTGKSMAGIIGGILTLILAGGIGLALKRFKKKR